MLHILFRNNNKAPNRDLIDFLDKNLTTIVKCKYVIKPTIVQEEKISDLIESGIKELPAMKFNQEICVGVNDIIDYIKRLCEKIPDKSKDENLDELVRDYMQKTLDTGEDEMSEDNQDSFNKKINEFKKGTGNSNNNNQKISQPQNKGPARPKYVNNNGNSNNQIISKPDNTEEKALQSMENNKMDDKNEILELSKTNNSQDDDMMAALFEKMGYE